MRTKAKKRKARDTEPAAKSEAEYVRHKLGTNQTRRAIRGAWIIHLYTQKDERIGELFTTLSHDRSLPLTLINAGSYIRSVMDNPQHSLNAPFAGMTTASAFEALVFFHALSVVSKEMKDRKGKIELS